MKKIKATFKGQNGSLGYIVGKQYILTFKQFVRGTKIYIVRHEDGKGECEYSDTITFFENWTDIKTEEV